MTSVLAWQWHWFIGSQFHEVIWLRRLTINNQIQCTYTSCLITQINIITTYHCYNITQSTKITSTCMIDWHQHLNTLEPEHINPSSNVTIHISVNGHRKLKDGKLNCATILLICFIRQYLQAYRSSLSTDIFDARAKHSMYM